MVVEKNINWNTNKERKWQRRKLRKKPYFGKVGHLLIILQSAKFGDSIIHRRAPGRDIWLETRSLTGNPILTRFPRNAVN